MKLKKIIAVCAALGIFAGMLTGCGADEQDSNSTTTALPDNSQSETDSGIKEEVTLKAPVNEGKINVKDGATENMLIRSVLREGDTSRLAQKLQMTVDDPKRMINIAFLGDSITAGSSASSTYQYTSCFTRWWDSNVSFYYNIINAGIGATDSYLAVHRAERDVLSLNPDIIFIEFINDADNDFYKASMDSLVRKCLSQENAPAVILIEMTMEDGTCPQRVHTEIAEAYDLPVISYHDAVLPEVEAGNIEWSEISPDNIHPNDEGHQILGQLLVNFVSGVKDNLDSADKEITTELPASPTGDIYANADLANRNSDKINVTDEGSFTGVCSFYSNFTDGWSTKTGGSITFEVEARNIGLVYNKCVDGTYGMAKITVDGEAVKSVNGDFTGGWGSYACMEEFYSSDETAKHTVTIEIADTDKLNFDIYSLLIS